MSDKKPNRLRQFIRRFSIPRQGVLAYLILIVVPAIAILYGSYERTTSILKEEASRSLLETLKQAGSNISFRMEQIEDTSNSLFMNAKLHRYLITGDEEQSVGAQMQALEELRNIVESVESSNSVFRVRLFVDDSKLYANERMNFFPLRSLESRAWYANIIKGNGKPIWTRSYQENYLGTGAVQIFSSARILRDPYDYDGIDGVLMIDVEEKMIADILSTLQLPPGTGVYLVDADGMIIYASHRERIGEFIHSSIGNELSQANEGIQKIELNNEMNDVIFTSLSSAGWKLVVQGADSKLSQRAVKSTQLSGLALIFEYTALLLILPFILLAITVRWMKRRVQHVISAIPREELEDWHKDSSVQGNFHMLEAVVDQLINRTRKLVGDMYMAKLQEREAQLRALQAQINPHFLYNTLDTINWIAIGKGAKDISQMINRLATYFRLSLNKGKDIVSLNDELNLAQVYLQIQQTRFPDTFTFQLNIPSGLETCLLPKLTLQPIIENALLHGIRKTKHKTGSILISASRQNDDLLISVTDDGIGIEEERLHQLLGRPSMESTDERAGSSYGLYNVNERIKLFAGEGYGITIDSRLDFGTTVTIKLKISG
jgi:two-component system sensor histidine kinase YesM